MEIKMYGRNCGKTLNLNGKPIKPKMTHEEYLAAHNNFIGYPMSSAETVIKRMIYPHST